MELSLKFSSFAVLVLLCFAFSATPHEMNTSYTRVDVQENQLTLSLTFDQTDLESLFDFDENGDNIISADELFVNTGAVYDSFESKLVLVIAGKEVRLERTRGSIKDDDLGNVFVELNFEKSLSFQPWRLDIRLFIFGDFGPKHKNLARITVGEETQQAIFTIGNNRQQFSFAGRDALLADQVGQFLWLGVEHILIGYDHILFLLGLIVLGGNFGNLVKIVTSFTVAHSITLALAALQIVVIPSRLVESVIALSIVYIAVENFLVRDTDQRWLITFIFGLMHGFGFASVLSELGLPTGGLVASLFSFNVGVEIGQLAIVAVVFPIIFQLSKSKWQKQTVYGLSSVIFILGLAWFIERAFALDLPLV